MTTIPRCIEDYTPQPYEPSARELARWRRQQTADRLKEQAAFEAHIESEERLCALAQLAELDNDAGELARQELEIIETLMSLADDGRNG